MDPQLITALSTMTAAITGLIVAVTALWRELKKTTATANETLHLVNTKSDEQTVRLDQLTGALTDRGLPVPVDPAVAAAERRIEQETP